MSTADLHQYFDAERQAGVLAVALGVASLAFAGYLWFGRSPFKAAMWPLIIVGLIELGVGIALVVRTAPQVQALDEGMRVDPRSTAAAEIQRMTRVNRSFRMIIGAEIVLLLAGVTLAVWLRTSNVTWSAIGMGVFLQAAVLLVFDLFAEHRAHEYTRWLASL